MSYRRDAFFLGVFFGLTPLPACEEPGLATNGLMPPVYRIGDLLKPFGCMGDLLAEIGDLSRETGNLDLVSGDFATASSLLLEIGDLLSEVVILATLVMGDLVMALDGRSFFVNGDLFKAPIVLLCLDKGDLSTKGIATFLDIGDLLVLERRFLVIGDFYEMPRSLVLLSGDLLRFDE